MAEQETVNYRATSAFTSKTQIFNVLSVVAVILALPEVVAILPPEAVQIIAVLNPLINMALRFITVRPIAFITPGTSTPVAVEKLG